MSEHAGSLVETWEGANHAECSCGWKGQQRDSRQKASDDLANHYEESKEKR